MADFRHLLCFPFSNKVPIDVGELPFPTPHYPQRAGAGAARAGGLLALRNRAMLEEQR
jgi:hypothetical protein